MSFESIEEAGHATRFTRLAGFTGLKNPVNEFRECRFRDPDLGENG
jgi:hypothetical protein